jgi:hypothetical protein
MYFSYNYSSQVGTILLGRTLLSIKSPIGYSLQLGATFTKVLCLLKLNKVVLMLAPAWNDDERLLVIILSPLFLYKILKAFLRLDLGYKIANIMIIVMRLCLIQSVKYMK